MGVPASAGVGGSSKGYKSRDLANGVVVGSFAAVGPGAAIQVWGPFNISVWGELADALTTTAGSATGALASGTSVAAGDTIVSANVPPGTTVQSGTTSPVMAFMPQWWAALINGIKSGSPTILMGAQPADLSTLLGATIKDSDFFAAGVTITAYDNTLRTLTASANATASMQPGASGALVEFAPTGNAIKVSGADANSVLMGQATPITLTLQLERSYDGGSRWTACNVGNVAALAQWILTKPLSLSIGEPEAGILYRLNCITYAAVANTAVKYRISTTGQASTSLSVPAI